MKSAKNTQTLSPVGLILVTLIVPSSLEKASSILQQFKLFLSFYSRISLSELHLLVLTNHEAAWGLLLESGLDLGNFTVDLVKNNELRFVQGREGENFEFAFAKIDAVMRSERILRSQESINAIVVTDVDAIFIDSRPIVKACLVVENMMAINYRSEQDTSQLFDQAMQAISFNSKWDKASNFLSKAWINSGFMILEKHFVLDLIETNDLLKRSMNMDRNRELIKKGCDNHFGDELLFSSLFSDVDGQEIPLRNTQLAQLIWTCETKANSLRLINPILPPAHLHIPAVKWSPYAMNLLLRFAHQRYTVLKTIIALNHWSITAHFRGGQVFAYLQALFYCLFNGE